jgi:isoleucyl-tRNA synthetase
MDDIEIQSEDLEGWLVATENGITVALDTTLDKELINEGIAREFVSRIQNLRKDSGFEVVDRIKIQYSASETIADSVNSLTSYITSETLAESIEFVAEIANATDIDLMDEVVKIKIEKT